MANFCRRISLLSISRVTFVSALNLVAVVCISHSCPAVASDRSKDIAFQPTLSPLHFVIPDHKADAKEVVNKLVAEDYEGIRKNFNDQMKGGLSAENMKAVWRAVIEHLGDYKSQAEPQSEIRQNWEIIVIKCEMVRGKVDVEVDYDPSGKIGGLWVRPVA
jgi:hypothetical protein